MNELIIIAILILLNGVLALSEIALISVRKSYLSNEVKKGNQLAKIALKLANEPDKFLSTVQIGITVIGILTGIYSGSTLANQFSEVLTGMGVPYAYAHPLAQFFIVVVVTYFTLIFGELVPKRIGMFAAEKASKIVARPMYWLSLIASPFVWLLAKSTSTVFGLLGLKNQEGKVTEEEIKSMIHEGTKGGEVQEVEQDIMERVFLLGDLKVSSLMTHRSDIVSMDINMTKEEILNVLQQSLHEVYPVTNGSFDSVEGIVSLKNLVLKPREEEFNVKELVTPATYFHENMSVYKALEQMKNLRISQAFICDEFGSFQGIISLKDILEGLVGTIEDTNSEPDIIKRKGHEGWLVDGQCPIYDFLSYFEKEHLYQKNNNYSTLAGLILEQLEHIPQIGETLTWKDFRLEIIDMDGARIDRILVLMPAD